MAALAGPQPRLDVRAARLSNAEGDTGSRLPSRRAPCRAGSKEMACARRPATDPAVNLITGTPNSHGCTRTSATYTMTPMIRGRSVTGSLRACQAANGQKLVVCRTSCHRCGSTAASRRSVSGCQAKPNRARPPNRTSTRRLAIHQQMSDAEQPDAPEHRMAHDPFEPGHARRPRTAIPRRASRARSPAERRRARPERHVRREAIGHDGPDQARRAQAARRRPCRALANAPDQRARHPGSTGMRCTPTNRAVPRVTISSATDDLRRPTALA